MLTEGSISSVEMTSLAGLANVSVLDLSHNTIATISDRAFHNLSLLQTLLLDHNQLSSLALGGELFSQLTHLEVLNLGYIKLTQVGWLWFFHCLILPG